MLECLLVRLLPKGAQKTGGSAEAGSVEQGMPATKHQQELLKTDDKAPSGQMTWMLSELAVLHFRPHSISKRC